MIKANEKSKPQRKIPKKKGSMELLHQRLGHIYTRSLLAVNTEKVYQDIDIKADPDPFCTSCQIYTINEKAISKKPLKSRTPFRWVFMYITLYTSPKFLTKDTTFSNHI